MRAKFSAPALPFGIFLLAAWQADTPSFPLLRLLQVNASLTLPAVFTASTLDRGQPAGGPVHSPFKQDPGRRAARALAAIVYGDATPYVGPRYAGAVAAGRAAATVRFAAASLAGAPLALNLSVSCPSTITAASCEAFALQTSDCTWWANVTAALAPGGDALVLALPAGAPAALTLVASRGLFGNWPVVQLYNGAALPAEPWLADIDGVTNTCPSPWTLAEAAAGEWRDDGRHA